MPDQPEPWYRRAAKREPLLTRAAISALTLAAAAVTTRYLGFEFDQDTVIAVILGWLGVTGAVIREGVYSPATVEKERQRAADEALLAAPTAPTATVVQVGADHTHTESFVEPSTGAAGQNPGETVEPDDAGHP